MELVGALEDARNMETERKERIGKKKNCVKLVNLFSLKLQKDWEKSCIMMMLANTKKKVWQRINEFNGKPIPIGDLLDRPEKASIVRHFRRIFIFG